MFAVGESAVQNVSFAFLCHPTAMPQPTKDESNLVEQLTSEVLGFKLQDIKQN